MNEERYVKREEILYFIRYFFQKSSDCVVYLPLDLLQIIVDYRYAPDNVLQLSFGNDNNKSATNKNNKYYEYHYSKLSVTNTILPLRFYFTSLDNNNSDSSSECQFGIRSNDNSLFVDINVKTWRCYFNEFNKTFNIISPKLPPTVPLSELIFEMKLIANNYIAVYLNGVSLKCYNYVRNEIFDVTISKQPIYNWKINIPQFDWRNTFYYFGLDHKQTLVLL